MPRGDQGQPMSVRAVRTGEGGASLRERQSDDGRPSTAEWHKRPETSSRYRYRGTPEKPPVTVHGVQGGQHGSPQPTLTGDGLHGDNGVYSNVDTRAVRAIW